MRKAREFLAMAMLAAFVPAALAQFPLAAPQNPNFPAPFPPGQNPAIPFAFIRDSTVRQTALAELEAMTPRTSQYNPVNAVPEKNLLYRLAKRFWFNDFGVYNGHDHSQTSAAGVEFKEKGGVAKCS